MSYLNYNACGVMIFKVMKNNNNYIVNVRVVCNNCNQIFKFSSSNPHATDLFCRHIFRCTRVISELMQIFGIRLRPTIPKKI